VDVLFELIYLNELRATFRTCHLGGTSGHTSLISRTTPSHSRSRLSPRHCPGCCRAHCLVGTAMSLARSCTQSHFYRPSLRAARACRSARAALHALDSDPLSPSPQGPRLRKIKGHCATSFRQGGPAMPSSPPSPSWKRDLRRIKIKGRRHYSASSRQGGPELSSSPCRRRKRVPLCMRFPRPRHQLRPPLPYPLHLARISST
jgi:hypothetical protein